MTTTKFIPSQVPEIWATKSIFTAWENITAWNALYISWNNVFKTDASNLSKINFIWFASANASLWWNVIVDTSWVSNAQSGLTAWSDYYLSNTPWTISTTPWTNIVSVWKAVSTTWIEIQIKNQLQNIVTLVNFSESSTSWIATEDWFLYWYAMSYQWSWTIGQIEMSLSVWWTIVGWGWCTTWTTTKYSWFSAVIKKWQTRATTVHSYTNAARYSLYFSAIK